MNCSCIDVAFDFGVVVDFCRSDVSMPLMQGRKWKKKWPLFERSEFRTFPIF